jgi:hypothetical protein
VYSTVLSSQYSSQYTKTKLYYTDYTYTKFTTASRVSRVCSVESVPLGGDTSR